MVPSLIFLRVTLLGLLHELRALEHIAALELVHTFRAPSNMPGPKEGSVPAPSTPSAASPGTPIPSNNANALKHKHALDTCS